MNTYHCFYKGKKLEIKANTTYEAQQLAAKEFKAKKSYDVTVMLVAKGDEPYIHSTSSL